MRVPIKIIVFIIISIGIIYPQQKKTIAVLDLEAKGIGASEASVLTDRLRSELINIEQYIVVDRKNMEEILEEQGFQQTGCTSDECVAEVGQLLGVQYMVSGTVGKFGKTFTIQLAILNIETGAIEQSANYDYEGALETLLKKGIRTALLRLLGIEDSPEAMSALKTGILELTISPPEANILIDAIKYAVEDVNNLELMVGRHTIEVSAPDYYNYQKEIVINQDTAFPLNVDLKYGKQDLQNIHRKNNVLKISTLAGIGSTIAAAYLAQSTYDKYDAATSIDDTENYRTKTKTLDSITLGLTVFSVAVTTYTLLNRSKEKKLEANLGEK